VIGNIANVSAVWPKAVQEDRASRCDNAESCESFPIQPALISLSFPVRKDIEHDATDNKQNGHGDDDWIRPRYGD
jgi:hypothetical protein